VLIVSAVNGSATDVGANIPIAGGSYSISAAGNLAFLTATKGSYNFNYTASDQHGGTSVATVTVTVTPVVLDLNGDKQLELISPEDSHVSLNLFAAQKQGTLGWVGPQDGLLIYDYQQDGKVTHIDEFAFSLYAPNAKTDLEGLRIAFDSNYDLIFDEKDDYFNHFGVWQDKNSNGITEEGEFHSLKQLGIQSIALASDSISHEQNGNMIFGSSSYQTSSGESQMLGDVGLKVLAYQDVIQAASELDLSTLLKDSEVQQTSIVNVETTESVLYSPHHFETQNTMETTPEPALM
jgi:hypothetical protein